MQFGRYGRCSHSTACGRLGPGLFPHNAVPGRGIESRWSVETVSGRQKHSLIGWTPQDLLRRWLHDQPPPLCSPPRCTSGCDQKKQPYVLSSRADRSRSCKVASSTLRLASNQRPFRCEAVPLRSRSVTQRPRLDRVEDSCGIGITAQRRRHCAVRLTMSIGGLDASGYPQPSSRAFVGMLSLPM